MRISGDQTAFRWLLATLGGIASISLTSSGSVLRLLLPIAAMISYVWISYPHGKVAMAGAKHLRIAQLADSAYFLGFLWTLWALIDSFVLKGADASADKAFHVFGYALVTTALGMAIRLYLLQFKYGALDQAAEADLAVEHHLQRYSAAMEQSLIAIKAFSASMDLLDRSVDRLVGTVGEADRIFENAHRETSDAIVTKISTVVEEIRGAMKAPVQEYGRAVRAFTANVDEHSKKLAQTILDQQQTTLQEMRAATQRISVDLGQLSTRIRSIELPTTGLEEASASFGRLRQQITDLGEAMSADGGFRAALTAFASEVPRRSSQLGEAIESVAIRIQTVRVPEQITVDLDALTRSVDALDRAVGDLGQRASDRRWETSADAASEAISKLTTTANKLSRSLDELASVSAPAHSKRWFWQK